MKNIGDIIKRKKILFGVKNVLIERNLQKDIDERDFYD